jgi:hypothetical protein
MDMKGTVRARRLVSADPEWAGMDTTTARSAEVGRYSKTMTSVRGGRYQLIGNKSPDARLLAAASPEAMTRSIQRLFGKQYTAISCSKRKVIIRHCGSRQSIVSAADWPGALSLAMHSFGWHETVREYRVDLGARNGVDHR